MTIFTLGLPISLLAPQAMDFLEQGRMRLLARWFAALHDEAGSAALAEIIVLAPAEDELAAHEATLAALDKESKGACLWLRS